MEIRNFSTYAVERVTEVVGQGGRNLKKCKYIVIN